VSTLGPQAKVIFLNLKDLRFWSCEDYYATLTAATRLNFGQTFYRDGVLLIQKDTGDSTKLKNLLDHWSACQ
jgi:hypothetical protein